MKFSFYVLLIAAGVAAWLYYPDYKEKLPTSVADAQGKAQTLWNEVQTTPTPAQAPRKQINFTPPDPLPKQDNWTWTTTKGDVYFNVKIVKVEADCVTILHKDGGARIETSTLPPPIQRQLNYTPDIAAEAAQQRSDDMAYTKEQLNAEATEIKSNEMAAAAVKNAAPASTNTDPDAPIKFRINDLQKIHDDLVAKANVALTPAGTTYYTQLAENVQKQIENWRSQLTTSAISSSSPPSDSTGATNAAPQ